MVELRKRREAPPSDGPQPPSKKPTPVTKSESKAQPSEAASPSANGTGMATTISVGDFIDLNGFGGDIETQDGEKTNLKKLVEDSKNGVVLFTYPKASTPGCKSAHSSFVDKPICLDPAQVHYHRYYTSVSVQGPVYSAYRYWLFNLWLVNRLSEVEYNV